MVKHSFRGYLSGLLRYHIEDRFYPISGDFSMSGVSTEEVEGSTEYLKVGLTCIGTLEWTVAHGFIESEFGKDLVFFQHHKGDSFYAIIKDITHPDCWSRIK